MTSSSSDAAEMEVVEHLVLKQSLDPQAAKYIYADANSIYHRVCTMTDTSEVDSTNNHTRVALCIILQQRFSLEQSCKYYLWMLLHIVFQCNDSNIEQVFIDWISFKLQDRGIKRAIEFCKFMLIGIKENLPINPSTNIGVKTILKCMNNNIQTLTEANTSDAETTELYEIKEKFNLEMKELNIEFSDSSDPDSDD